MRRGIKKTVYVGARIEPDVHAQLVIIAKSQERSKSQLIRWILQHYIRNPELLKQAVKDFI